MPEIVNKFTYGVLPEYMDMLLTLSAVGTEITHGFTFITLLLSTYEFRYVFKRPITLLKVLCAFHIEENIQKLVPQIARLEWNHVAKMA